MHLVPESSVLSESPGIGSPVLGSLPDEGCVVVIVEVSVSKK